MTDPRRHPPCDLPRLRPGAFSENAMTTPPDMIWLDLTQHAQGYTADPAEAREGRKSGLRIAAASSASAAAYSATSGDPLTQSRFGVLGRHILAAAEKEADHE
jgi:hypothetical protein